MDALKRKGYNIGGMISREVRKGGARVGFEIVDLKTGRRGWLAQTNQTSGPQVGKYRVNLNELEAVGASSIVTAASEADLVVVDEIGPMELCSLAFKEAVILATGSNKPMLGTIHYKARDPLIDTIKAREDAEILEVTHANRDCLHSLIIEKANQVLQRKLIKSC